MFVGVVVVVALVEVDVEIGSAAEEVFEGGVGNVAAVILSVPPCPCVSVLII